VGNTTLSIIAGNFSGPVFLGRQKIVLAFSRAPSHNLSFVKRFNIRKGALAESVTGAGAVSKRNFLRGVRKMSPRFTTSLV
jgi:hypothetical protein